MDDERIRNTQEPAHDERAAVRPRRPDLDICILARQAEGRDEPGPAWAGWAGLALMVASMFLLGGWSLFGQDYRLRFAKAWSFLLVWWSFLLLFSLGVFLTFHWSRYRRREPAQPPGDPEN